MTAAESLPRAPTGLSDRSRDLWGEVVASFELSPAELTLLHEALTALDRAAQAGEVVAAEGVVVLDRYGSPKAHPAVDVEIRNRNAFAAIVRQLGVKLVEEGGPARAGRPAHKAKERS